MIFQLVNAVLMKQKEAQPEVVEGTSDDEIAEAKRALYLVRQMFYFSIFL